MQIKKSAVLVMAVAVSSIVLLVLSSKAEVGSVLRVPKSATLTNGPDCFDPTSIYVWEVLSRLMVRPAA